MKRLWILAAVVAAFFVSGRPAQAVTITVPPAAPAQPAAPGVAPATAPTASPGFLDGLKTDFVYIRSFAGHQSAVAARASIPVIRLKKPLIGSAMTFNLDPMLLEGSDGTQAAIGGSVTIQGLALGSISLGAAYISGNYKWVGYASVAALSF